MVSSEVYAYNKHGFVGCDERCMKVPCQGDLLTVSRGFLIGFYQGSVSGLAVCLKGAILFSVFLLTSSSFGALHTFCVLSGLP